MRTTRKSVYALTAGIAGLALVATGCSSAEEKPAAPSDKASATADGPKEPVTLTISTFNEFGYENYDEDGNAPTNLFDEYTKANPHVTIKHDKIATADEAREKLTTGLAAGSGLSDIVAVEIDWLAEFLQYADKFNDLTDPALEGRWVQAKYDGAKTADGKLIGYGTDMGPQGLCYRPDLFKEAGLPTDRTEVAALLEGGWDKYFAEGEKFVAKSDAAWFDSAGATYQGMINQVEQSYEAPDGTVLGIENDVVKKIYDDVLSASVDKDLSAHLGQWSDDWKAGFQKDAFATMLCPGWMLGVVEGNSKGKTWDFADVYPGGGGNWGGSYLTVPTQSKNADEAKALAAWLTAPEQQVKAFEAKGQYPSAIDAQNDPKVKSATNKFFNDAPYGEILANRAAAIKVTPYKGKNYFAVHNVVSNALTRVDVDKTDDAASSWEKAKTEYAELGLS